MISQLHGTILAKQPPIVVLDVHGVGYELLMPMTCIYELPEVGQTTTILTQFIVREDAQLLYGFNHASERVLFREVIKVNGVGPKLALAILSGMTASQFIAAVEHEEINHLIKLPGVGKKTAERLIVEMKDRFKGLNQEMVTETDNTPSTPSNPTQREIEKEAIIALVALGYKQQEAQRMVQKVAKAEDNCETLIRNALRTVW